MLELLVFQFLRKGEVVDRIHLLTKKWVPTVLYWSKILCKNGGPR